MKVSLIVSSASEAQVLVEQAQAQLAAAELEVSLELVTQGPEAEPIAALFQALGDCTGEWIAVLGPGAEAKSLLTLLEHQRSLRDRELTAVMLEPRLGGAARFRRMGHRLLCRLGGKRSPPGPEASVLFQRRWVPALLRLPLTPEWDLPLALAVLGVEWKRGWTAPAAGLTAPARRLSGWRRLLLIGGLFELGLLGAVALYALSGALIIMGSRSSWAAKGGVGIGVGVVLVLAFGTVQLLARRKLRSALSLSADVRAELVRPDEESRAAPST